MRYAAHWILVSLITVGCGSGFETADWEHEGGSPGFPLETGGSATGGSLETGGSATGGSLETGGSATGGSLETGGSATGGSLGTGVLCGDQRCTEGLSCCEPYTSTAPFCIPDPNPERLCQEGWYHPGAVLECTSHDDCDGLRCCLYKVTGSDRISSSECGNCADGAGAFWPCEQSTDCAPGRYCRQRDDLSFKTCAG